MSLNIHGVNLFVVDITPFFNDCDWFAHYIILLRETCSVTAMVNHGVLARD